MCLVFSRSAGKPFRQREQKNHRFNQCPNFYFCLKLKIKTKIKDKKLSLPINVPNFHFRPVFQIQTKKKVFTFIPYPILANRFFTTKNSFRIQGVPKRCIHTVVSLLLSFVFLTLFYSNKCYVIKDINLLQLTFFLCHSF